MFNNFKKQTIMKKKYFSILALMPLFFSCSSDVATEDMPATEVEAVTNEVFNLNIIYDGKEYNVPCTLDKDDNLVYLDEEFKNLYDTEISKFKELVTFEREDGKIVYYPSEAEMFKQLGYTLIDEDAITLVKNGVKTRVSASAIAGRVTMWDDTGYKDRSITFETTYKQFSSCPALKYYNNFNDKTSALKVWSYIPKNDSVMLSRGLVEGKFNEMPGIEFEPDKMYSTNDLRVVFLGYHNSNYGGVKLCCIPENTGVAHEHSSLKSIGWNDKISAVVLRIAVKGLYPADH